MATQVKHRPFHSYTMKQAIEEGFILDVLKNYTPVDSYYRLDQDGRRRSGVRHQAGEEEAAALRREQRPRDPAEGRDHGRPLPRAGAGAEQDRRPGAGDGRHQRHRAGDPVLPRDSATISTNARALTRPSSPSPANTSTAARRSRKPSLNGFPSQPDRRQDRRRPVPVPRSAPTSSRPATTSRCCTRCMWTSRSPASRRCRPCRG